MSHFRRILWSASALLMVIVLIVFLTRVAGPLFGVADTMAIGQTSNPFYGAYDAIKTISYFLVVPVFLIAMLVYLIFGPAQDELQRERRRRQP